METAFSNLNGKSRSVPCMMLIVEFATLAKENGISVTDLDSRCHIGIATGSKMLKVGIVGGERIAKLNEMIRISEHDLIRGMAKL